MDITPQDNTIQPISDDQELAKALAGVLPDEPEEPVAESTLNSGFQFEEMPASVPDSAPPLNTIESTLVAADPSVVGVTPPGDASQSLTDQATNAPTPQVSAPPTPIPAPSLDVPSLDAQSFELPELPQPEEALPTQSSAISTPSTSSDTSELDNIKNQALNELRPLIDHVAIPAEEKFDTYLMLLRSTDDASLIAPAHAAAKDITDDKRKAEALLDVIKEIDYLSKKDQG